MRIAIFTDSYPPRIDGIARVCQLERLELERLGHEVRVLCPDRPGRPYRDDPSVIALPSVPGLLYEGLRLGRFTRRAKRELMQWQPELVHVHTPLSVGLSGLRFARRQDIPSITTCHADFDLAAEYPALFVAAAWLPLVLRLYVGYRPRWRELGQLYASRRVPRKQFWSRWLFAQASNAATYTTTPSAKITAQITPFVHGPVYTVGFGAEVPPPISGVDVQAFRTQQHISHDAFVIASTTRLVKEKRVELLIQALAQARQERPDLPIVLAVMGDGPEKSHLHHLARSLDVAEHVRFTGRLDNIAIRTALPACNLYANASLRETFALSACEAALAGLPLLMCDAELQGIFLPDKTGLLCHDAASCAKQFIALATQPALCKRLGATARTTAEQYTPAHAVRQLLALTKS